MEHVSHLSPPATNPGTITDVESPYPRRRADETGIETGTI